MSVESSASLLAPKAPDLVWFRGPDTIRFLNDIISQEIAGLEPGRVARSLLLGPQGKLDHILWALRGEDEVGLVTDHGRGEELAETLGRYRIRVDVEIEQSAEPAWLVMGDWGAEAGHWKRTDTGIVADVSWPTLQRTFVTGEEPDLPVMEPGEYEHVRIEAGEPAWGVDVNENTIPHESELVPVTVDFSKGCFLGQELVARIDSRGGNVPRHLRLVDLGDVTVEPGTTLTADGKDVGTVTSTAGSVAMAVIKRGVEPGDEVTVGDRRVTVRALPEKEST